MAHLDCDFFFAIWHAIKHAGMRASVEAEACMKGACVDLFTRTSLNEIRK